MSFSTIALHSCSPTAKETWETRKETEIHKLLCVNYYRNTQGGCTFMSTKKIRKTLQNLRGRMFGRGHLDETTKMEG